MTREILFTALFLAACGYALLRGGRPEQLVAFTFIIGQALSLMMMSLPAKRYDHISIGTLLVDLAMLLVIGRIALTSERYWPLCMTAMQLLQVIANLSILLPGAISLVYAITTSVIAYPMLTLLMIATYRFETRAKAHVVK